jgi:hypothetical protein
VALLASVATAVLFLLSGTFQTVLATTVLLGVSIEAICYLSLFILRRREPKARRPYRAWGYPWTTAAALLIALALVVGVAVSTPASGLDTLLLLAAILTVVLLRGMWLLFLQLWPYNRFGPYCYWVATHRGRNALLVDARLRFASLPGADLQGAALGFADLAGADLAGAHLAGAILRHTNLRGARPRQADLHGADLIGADLRGADLRGVDMTGAKLYFTPADLKAMPPGGSSFPLPNPTWNILKVTGARCDAHTRWPADFDPLRHGAMMTK